MFLFQTLIVPKPTQITIITIFIGNAISKAGKIAESYAKTKMTASFGLGCLPAVLIPNFVSSRPPKVDPNSRKIFSRGPKDVFRQVCGQSIPYQF